MGDRIFTMEAGTDGGDVTTGNHGTGTINVVKDSGADVKFESTAPYQGAMAARFSYPASGSSGAQVFIAPDVVGPLLSFTDAFRLESDLSINTAISIVQFRTASTALWSLRLVWTSTGTVCKIRLFVGSTDTAEIGTISENDAAWYRVEAQVDSSTGGYTFKLRDGVTDAQIGSTVSGTSAGMVGNIETVRFGVIASGVAVPINVRHDYVGLRTGSLTPWGPPANEAPIVTAGADLNVAASAANSLTIVATDNDGTVSSVVTSVTRYSSTTAPASVSVTGGTTLTPSWTGGAAGTVDIATIVATDNLGAVTTIYVERRVLKSGDFTTLRMDGVNNGGSWTRAGSAISDGAALADADDTTYTESPDYTVTEAWEEYRLEPIISRSDLVIPIRTYETVVGGTVVARLMDNGVQRQQWTVTQSTVAANQNLTVSTPGAISDWGKLAVRFAVIS